MHIAVVVGGNIALVRENSNTAKISKNERVFCRVVVRVIFTKCSLVKLGMGSKIFEALSVVFEVLTLFYGTLTLHLNSASP